MRAAVSLLVILSASSLAATASGQGLRLTVEEAVARARRSNVLLRSTATGIASAQASLERSRFWVPQDPFFSGGLLQTPQTGFGPNYGLSLSQEFEVAGQRKRRMAVAEASVQRAQWEQRAAELNLAAAVTIAFNDALVAAERVALAERGAEAVRDFIDRAAEMDGLSAGAARMDRNQLAIQEARMRRDLASARRARETDMDYLRYLLDVPQDQALELSGALSRQKRELPALAHLVSQALVHRPDLLALRHDTERAARQIALAKREGVPNITLTGSVSRFGDDTFAGGDISFLIPVLRGNEPELLEALAERDRAELQVNDLEQDIERQVRLARRICSGAEEDLQLSLDVILPRVRENLEIQRQRFEQGEIGALEMIGVVAEVQFAEREALDVVQSYNDSWVELKRVLAAEP